MIRNDGYVKVLDFGLVRLFTAGEAESSGAPGALIGTARYMSPDQARGGSVETPSDVFSLGIVLYEMAAGRHPLRRIPRLERCTRSRPQTTAAFQPESGNRGRLG